jgi:hypothetical protein
MATLVKLTLALRRYAEAGESDSTGSTAEIIKLATSLLSGTWRDDAPEADE